MRRSWCGVAEIRNKCSWINAWCFGGDEKKNPGPLIMWQRHEERAGECLRHWARQWMVAGMHFIALRHRQTRSTIRTLIGVIQYFRNRVAKFEISSETLKNATVHWPTGRRVRSSLPFPFSDKTQFNSFYFKQFLFPFPRFSFAHSRIKLPIVSRTIYYIISHSRSPFIQTGKCYTTILAANIF